MDSAIVIFNSFSIFSEQLFLRKLKTVVVTYTFLKQVVFVLDLQSNLRG